MLDTYGPLVRRPCVPAHHGSPGHPHRFGISRWTPTTAPWRCRAVVVATGTEGESEGWPALARNLPDRLHQITAPALPGGRGRVRGRAPCWSSGASASGVQIADEPAGAAGGQGGDRRRRRPRPGCRRHLPRSRHLPTGWTSWASSTSAYDEGRGTWSGPRRLPSMQLAGTPGRRRSMDLGHAVPRSGVTLTGRFVGGSPRDRAPSSPGRWPTCSRAADLKQARLLDRVDGLRRRARPAGLGRATRPSGRRPPFPKP